MNDVGLLVVATRGYRKFLIPLLRSVQEHFFPNDLVTIHVFSESSPFIPVEVTCPVAWHQIPAYGWPDATLLRYREFDNAAMKLYAHNWLFYVDVDARFEKPVGTEVLPTRHQLVGLLHSGFNEGDGTWETRPESRAYVPPENRCRYFMGGFNGGDSQAFLSMASVIARDADRDRSAGITAVWHDESHLNQFFSVVTPKVLPRSFSAPEQAGNVGQSVTWLLKDHNAVRNEESEA